MAWWEARREGPEDLAPEEAPSTIGPVATRRQAREWALVLQSQGIDSSLELRIEGWLLHVDRGDRERAQAAIGEYEKENVDWPPVRAKDTPRYEPSGVVPLAFVALAFFFLFATGPSASDSAWFVRGTADARLLWREPWRMVTALTLHGDGKHVLGNLVSGSIFGAAVSRRIGPGGALMAILCSGFVGNAANAIYHHAQGHLSIGASTAVFGAVGLLAALQMWVNRQRPKQIRTGLLRVVDLGAPIVGGLALLGALGAAPQSDIWAHLFGFAAGATLGVLLGFVERGRETRPASRWVQLALGSSALLVVVGCWKLAMMH